MTAPPALPAPPTVAASSQTGLVAGIRLALRGLLFAIRHAEVRRAYVRLVLANLLVALVLEVLGGWAVLHVTTAADGASGWAVAGLVALRIAGLLAVLVTAPVVAIVLVNLALPMLAERLFLTGLGALDASRADALRAAKGLSLRTEVVISLRRLVRFVLLSVGALLLSLVPGVGVVLGSLAQVLVTASFLGWELLDPWLAKEALPYGAQCELLARHRGLVLGFALPFVPLLAIPLVGPLFVGLAQSASAVLVSERLRVEPRVAGPAVSAPPGGAA